MTKEQIQAFTFRVSSANKTEMIVILYDIAITYLNDSVSAKENDNKTLFRAELNRTKSTVQELMNSVDTSTELGLTLLKLYVYCNRELTKAYLDFDDAPARHVISILSRLREAYEVVSKKDKSESVMKNVEIVYGNLTYNKNLMNEILTDRAQSRGYLA
ncbi:MAG: flagellar protein FliS [Lachnospiraceae bacterium]|nr:flagellar protein FliS [Lachnospiraceae bacterium]